MAIDHHQGQIRFTFADCESLKSQDGLIDWEGSIPLVGQEIEVFEAALQEVQVLTVTEVRWIVQWDQQGRSLTPHVICRLTGQKPKTDFYK